jgi:hypothetical protein
MIYNKTKYFNDRGLGLCCENCGNPKGSCNCKNINIFRDIFWILVCVTILSFILTLIMK